MGHIEEIAGTPDHVPWGFQPLPEAKDPSVLSPQGEVPLGGDRHRRTWWRVPRSPGPLRRSVSDRMAGGVAGGLSARLGVNANLIRGLFLLLILGDGTGFAIYVVLWLAIPMSGDSVSVGRRAVVNHGALQLALSMAIASGGVLIALAAVGVSPAAGLIWPVPISVAGLILVWRGAEGEEKAFLNELLHQVVSTEPTTRRSRRATTVRLVLGVVLVLAGVIGVVIVRRPTFATVATLDGAVAVIIGGLLVVFGPWWLRLAHELAVERRERVRSQERADMAATIHDSVLQTLALIQREAADSREVTRLARAQERDLRTWLFEGRPPGTFDSSQVSTVAEAVGVIEREVEENHRVSVEAVVVGDCSLADEQRALLGAGREAAVNAARWSGALTVSIFVEVEPGQVSLFVRDKGKGFDPDSVADGHRGITDSIRARMARYGGSVSIRSQLGEGTEVELVMPRAEGRT
ncbi:MAG: PspC domain-containing protein [Acidimicrobiales bacterium]